MNEIKINVGGPWNNTCMGKQDAVELFNNIPDGESHIIFDFSNILYVGFLFVKEYLLLKESADIEISEIIFWDRVQDIFDLVEYFGLELSDDELIQKFIDYEL